MSIERKEWVAGFLFTEDFRSVALIRKARPEWQAGKLNGVGGKIEPGETPEQAMVREWTEEANAGPHNWREFCQLVWAEGTVHFFMAYTAYKTDYFRPDTDEPVRWHYVADAIKYESIIPNLAWLLRLASDKDQVTAVVHEKTEGQAWTTLKAQPATGLAEALSAVERERDGWRMTARGVRCLDLDERVSAAEQAVAALSNAAPSGWQGMETAPKDGTRFLAMFAGGHMAVSRFVNDSFFASDHLPHSGDTEPKAWTPLPPTQETETP